ncbi:hypothetical protein HNP47_000207 [Brevundimonas vesicularis]|uniref:Uncharacterized protein n=1 Tax=Brevundimonas vesicularis TaxID=41276 RepID=A0A7W9FRL8_BREVE|nr:hypothetical protein [Brevundimonas vesicularis]MBB5770238.1 hypothetical protein [Brevundimonas vesicularis]
MNPLAQKIIDAHGGLEIWRRFSSLTAHLKQGGALWALKGQGGKLDETDVTVGLQEEWASHHPFGPDGKVTHFRPGSVEIKDRSGAVVESLDDPRASFAGHALETPWTEPQLAYFAGIAMWTYLNTPFLLAYHGVESEPLSDWSENGETWSRLRVVFPKEIATHSTVQTLYADVNGLLKRHDYDVEIAGDTPGAHYISDYTTVSGLRFPTRRRIYPRHPDGTSLREPLVVSIDLSNITLR